MLSVFSLISFLICFISSVISFRFISVNFRLMLYLNCENYQNYAENEISGYAKGEQEYNASPIVGESDENENEIEEDVEPEDYEGDRCSDDQFTCKNLQCISVDQRCDGTRHCTDESDEFNCTFHRPPGD